MVADGPAAGVVRWPCLRGGALSGVIDVGPIADGKITGGKLVIDSACAIGQEEPDLVSIQLPFHTGDPWLGLEVPSSFTPSGDRLLYTAHYGPPFNPGDKQ